MIAFQVNDMRCDHCASTITRAVQEIDPEAKVRIDLASHRVELESARADAQRLSAAILDAGYTPLPA